MKITLRSVGGFTGPAGARDRTVDVETLPKARAERIERLVATLRSTLAGGGAFEKAAPQSWDFLHTLRIDDDGKPSIAFRFHEDAAPPALKELYDELET